MDIHSLLHQENGKEKETADVGKHRRKKGWETMHDYDTIPARQMQEYINRARKAAEKWEC